MAPGSVQLGWELALVAQHLAAQMPNMPTAVAISLSRATGQV